MQNKKFKINKTYVGANGNPDFRFNVKILKRTEKTITFQADDEPIKTKKIFTDPRNNEYFYPLGVYSAQPLCRCINEVNS